MNLKKIHFSIFAAACVLLTACSGAPKKSPEDLAKDEQRSTIDQFENANRLLDEKQYADAAKTFDSLRVAYPTSQLDYFIIFNAGIAYQSMGDCATAAERYRSVIRLTTKVPRTQALARVRLSDTLICLGDDKKAMVNLIEVYKNRKHLTPEIGEAEVPARLAAAYARDGNGKMAEKYFKIAEMGLAQVRASKNMPKDQKDVMARTLFLMGNMVQLNPQTVTSEDYFNTVKSLQKYLYRAVEMNVPDWSAQASEQIVSAYDKTWHYLDQVEIQNAPLKEAAADKVMADRATKAQKIAVAKTALASIKGLYNARVPSPEEPEVVKDLLANMRRQEAKIEGFLALNVIGNSRTGEAEKVESVKQEGRFKK
jgi:tetratricopeptide (TPR) repeat protein